MKLPRRNFLLLAAGAVAVPAVSRIARAQTYPTRPVRLVVGYTAGGGNDITARLMGQWLSERLGQQFIVDNRPGAGSNIAAEAVVRAPADGHTLLLAGAPNAINVTFYDKLNFNFARDVAPVASIMRVPLVMVVHPSFAAKTVPEFIAYAKANPRNLNMGSAGAGGPDHMAGELFKIMAGVSTLPAAIEYLRAGKLRALAVTTTMRSQELPEIPTVGDFFPSYEASQWYGVVAPKNTPAEIVERLNKEINAGLADPKLTARLADLGGTMLPGSPADFGKLIAEEIGKWGKVVRASNVKAE
jgi:tripartite-type tricarboxylate transporter receptor subunit TctC